MARVQMEEIVEHLRTEMRRALEDAVKQATPGAQFDSHDLYREFRRAVGRRCNMWEEVPEPYVDTD